MDVHITVLWLVCVSVCQAITYIDLTGKWTVSNKAKGISIPGMVPGSMYSAMHASGKISDPRYRDNDVKLRWMALDDWTYTRTFQVPPAMLKSGSVLLVCDGLDTVSTVYVNDKMVGMSDNMFLQYIYDIKQALKDGANEIRVEFQSAVRVSDERYNASSYPLPVNCDKNITNGECHGNMVRKPAYMFQWDGGPCFPTQGIWQPIYVQAFDTAVIRQVALLPQQEAAGGWRVDVTVSFDISGNSVTGTLDTDIIGTPVSMSKSLTLTPENNTIYYTLTVPSTVHIEKWWPRGYGAQTLYMVNVTFSDQENKEISNRKHAVGFRTVELVQDPVGQNQGSTFYYKINGIPVYLKGASLMPIDSFLENATAETYRRLLTSAAEANMNVIRLNGHGIYEKDIFYDLADELGIMVWQDFMFSLALYPVTAQFLDSVTQEVTYQIRRLKRHPCIIQWAGSNEIEVGLVQNWFRIKDIERYRRDYVKLFVITLKFILDREDPTRAYFTSCPSNGKEDEKEGWLSKNPADQHYADVHYYNYTADMWEANSYLIPRLATEYGLQAWSGVEDLEHVLLPEDFDYSGHMLYHRQHHPNGMEQMMTEVLQHFKKPTSNDTAQFFKDMIYLIQINQAVGIKGESEHFRRWQNRVTSDGRGHTMGSIYWQLHALWQAPNWASIDFNLKWRMLHYYTRKFYAPKLISPYFDGDGLILYAVIDEINVKVVKNTGDYKFVPAVDSEDSYLMNKTRDAVYGTVYIQMYRWDQFYPLKTWTFQFKLTTMSQEVYRQSVSSMVSEAGCPDRSYCFLKIYLTSPGSASDNHIPLTYYKDAHGLQKADVKITDVIRVSDTYFTVNLSTNRIAPFVWLDAYKIPGRFSDNGFLMLRESWTVNFTSWESVDIAAFKNSLTVKSLMDVYS